MSNPETKNGKTGRHKTGSLTTKHMTDSLTTKHLEEKLVKKTDKKETTSDKKKN